MPHQSIPHATDLPHPAIVVLDPTPELPTGVDMAYVKGVMGINLALPEAIRDRLAANPFAKLDAVILNAQGELLTADRKFPGSKVAMDNLVKLAPGKKRTYRGEPCQACQGPSKAEAGQNQFCQGGA